MRPYPEKYNKKALGALAQVIKHLCKALNLTPHPRTTAKKKKKKINYCVIV
jgi:hypothetical protein